MGNAWSSGLRGVKRPSSYRVRYNIRKTVSKKKWLGEELAAVSDIGSISR